MVDMDQTLIEAVTSNDPRYVRSDGKEISYIYGYSDQNGINISATHTVKVSIRPHACEMIRVMVQSGHRYIIWSAGVHNYVHAVMEYFTSTCGVSPEIIYTRENMIPTGRTRYKSMTQIGYPLDTFIILEDNPELVFPRERERVVKVVPWVHENIYDQEMSWVIEALRLYADDTPNPIRLF